MKTTTQVIVAVSMVAGLMVAGEGVRADQVALGYTEAAPPAATIRAEALEREARALFTNPKQYGRAAQLLEEAAGAREMGDPERIRDLELASRLTFYRGNERKSQLLMTQAAEEALAMGDVVTAAHNYTDAAFAAKAGKRPVEAIALVKKATLLAASPLLAKEDRAAILARVQA